MIKILITGAAGFVGHHIAEHILKNTDWKIVIIDKLSYSSSGYDRLREIGAYDNPRVKLLSTNLNLEIPEGLSREIGETDYVLHLAAESHVDNSIANPVPFIKNNIESTLNLLEWARRTPSIKKFIYFSTDEVFGSAPQDYDYKEGERFNPGNPYSASKAGSECICMAYANTYKLPIMIVNTMNIIGERQDPEKFLPKVINCCLKGETVYIHSNPDKTKAGVRRYIHARNVADGILFILNNINETVKQIDASAGKFNIVGELELDNLQFAQMIAKAVGKELKYEMMDFHSSRPGHDLRYGLDGTKLKNLGWQPKVDLENSVKKTVAWTLARPEWLK
jgi:dTDP-glucose 4,6-dehydratase